MLWQYADVVMINFDSDNQLWYALILAHNTDNNTGNKLVHRTKQYTDVTIINHNIDNELC